MADEIDVRCLAPTAAAVLIGGAALASWCRLAATADEEDNLLARDRRAFGAAAYATLVGTTFFVTCPPLKQSQAYHNLADRRRLDFRFGCCCRRGIPNASDVLSNVPFAFVAAVGLVHLYWRRDDGAGEGIPDMVATALLQAPTFANPDRERILWATYYVGVGLVSVGSAWYHWDPNDERLAWDRLPMTVSFAALLAVVLGETVMDDAIPPIGLAALVCLGVGSVVHWRVCDDLRSYAVVQFGTLAAIPLLYGLFPSRYDGGTSQFMVALVIYAVAKVAESLDDLVFSATGGRVSGHTVKHLLSALAAGWAVLILSTRSMSGSETVLVPSGRTGAVATNEL